MDSDSDAAEREIYNKAAVKKKDLKEKEEEVVTATVAFRNTHDIMEAQRRCRDVYDRYLAPGAWCNTVMGDIVKPFLLGPS